MATQEQERRSPPLETARAASDEPQLPGLVPIAGGSAATTTTMATGDIMAGVGDDGEEEQAPERAAVDNVRSSSPRVVRSGYSLVISAHIASPQFQRKPRSHVPARAPPAQWWRFKLPVLPVPPAPAAKKKTRKRRAKKRDMPCLLCKATETPLWRTWPTDRRVPLCNACGIKVRTPGLLLPELLYLSPPATATTTVVDSAELKHPVAPPPEIQPSQLYVNLPPPPAPEVAVLPSQLHVNLPPPASATTTTVVSASELEHPPPQQEIQDSDSSSPYSPTLDSSLDLDVYLLRRTSPRRREKSPSPSPPPPPPPPPTAAEFAPAAAAPAPAPGIENDEPERSCLHCGATSTRQWRMGPMGVRTLCNPCGVRYRQNRLVPEYRPKASPSFNQEVHSNLHREVVQIRRKQNHPALPAKYKPIRTRKRRRNKGKGPAQVPKKRKGNQEPNQQPAAAAQPAAVEVLLVRKKGNTQRLPPEPALLKLRKERNGEEHCRRSPQPAQAQPHAGDGTVQHEPPPPPPLALLPHTGNDDIVQDLPPPPPPAQPHAGDDMVQDLNLPPALPHAGGELMMDDPIPPPDPFLFDGPAAPRIIDDDPVVVIVIDDD